MKIICVGRNYEEHARELNNPTPESPLLFLKPSTALLSQGKPFYYPDFSRDIQYEVEVVLRIGGSARHVEERFAPRYYPEITVGIDFTARDLQNELKHKGHPWEIAKAFDHSAAVGTFRPFPAGQAGQGLVFSLYKNGTCVQDGNTRDMIFSFDRLIAYASRFFRLQSGDLFFTGTPAGVGPVSPGDVLEGYLEGEKCLHCEIR